MILMILITFLEKSKILVKMSSQGSKQCYSNRRSTAKFHTDLGKIGAGEYILHLVLKKFEATVKALQLQDYSDCIQLKFFLPYFFCFHRLFDFTCCLLFLPSRFGFPLPL